jgi:hypothetical protein
MYAPGMGRFLTRDAWGGDANNPITFNSWQYAYANPINLADPSGHDPWWCDFEEQPAKCIDDWIKAHIIPTIPPLLSTPTLCPPTPFVTPSPTPYVEPWKRYKDYDPISNSIPWSKWGGLDNDQWDIDRAELVWNWLGEAGKRPDVQILTAWLLWHESGALFSEIPQNDVYHDGGGQDGAKYMIRYMKGLFSNGIDKGDLGKFTAFFNPSRNGVFDQSAWDELMKRPADKPYFNTVRDFWNLEPIYRDITWWVPGESGFEQYAKSKFLTVKYPASGTDIMYFAYK